MQNFFTALTLVAVTSFSAMAANVTFPDTLVMISSANGETQIQDQQVTLANGHNIIKLRYKDNFHFNGGWIKSEVLYLLINSDDRQDYQVSTPVINSKYQARNFINNPVVTLTGSQGSAQTVSLFNHQQLKLELAQL